MSNMGGTGGPTPGTEVLLQRVAGMIAGARALPLSSSVKLDNKDEILELLREAVDRLPDELRQSRWLLKEREEYLAATQRKGEELVEAARSEAQRLVQRTEIVKEAQMQARRTVEEAREEARRLRLEAEDYADQKLAQFEIVLERTMRTVASGRQKLAGLPERDEGSTGGATPEGRPRYSRTAPAPASEDRRQGAGAPVAAGRGPGLAEPSTLPTGAWEGRPDGPPASPVPVDEGIFDQDTLS